MLLDTIPLRIQRQYVNMMMNIIARGLVSSSQIDDEIQRELKGLPQGFIFSMQVFPDYPRFFLRINDSHQLQLLDPHHTKNANLTITFKHLNHAFLVFSFQESTAQAFANDRMIADGDIHYAIRMVRCLNRMEALILPKKMAKMALKQYPNHLLFKEKMKTSSKIYFQIVKSIWANPKS